MRRPTAPVVLPLLALALVGCRQPAEANNNGPQDQPTRPAGVVREPQVVETAPLTVDPPGPTRSP